MLQASYKEHSQVLASNSTKLTVFSVAFVALVVIGIFSRGIWTDEAYTMGLLAGHFHSTLPDGIFAENTVKQELLSLASPSAVFTELLEADTHPPAYFALAYSWAVLFGKTLESLRFLSLLFGAIACWAFFDLIKRYQPETAFKAVVLFAFSSSVLHYSAEARPYIASIAFLILTSSFLVRSWQEEADKIAISYAVLSGISAAACFLTNYLALFPIGAIYLWAMLQGKYWKKSFISAGTAMALSLLWVPIFLTYHLEARPFQGAGWLGWAHASLTIIQDTIHTLFAPVNASYPTSLHWAGRILFLALALFGLKSLKAPSQSPAANISILMALIAISTCLGMLLLNFAFDKHLAEPRYLLPAVISFTFFIAQGVQQLKKASPVIQQGAFVLALAFLISAANWGSTTAHFYGKTVYRDIASKFQEVSTGSDIIVAGTGFGAANTGALFYELPQQTHTLILKPSLNADAIIEQISRYERIWFVQVGEKTKELETALRQQLMNNYVDTESIHHITIFEKQTRS